MRNRPSMRLVSTSLLLLSTLQGCGAPVPRASEPVAPVDPARVVCDDPEYRDLVERSAVEPLTAAEKRHMDALWQRCVEAARAGAGEVAAAEAEEEGGRNAWGAVLGLMVAVAAFAAAMAYAEEAGEVYLGPSGR